MQVDDVDDVVVWGWTEVKVQNKQGGCSTDAGHTQVVHRPSGKLGEKKKKTKTKHGLIAVAACERAPCVTVSFYSGVDQRSEVRPVHRFAIGQFVHPQPPFFFFNPPNFLFSSLMFLLSEVLRLVTATRGQRCAWFSYFCIGD